MQQHIISRRRES